MITVLQPGAFSTVQDRGRRGYQAWGLPSAGAMDPYAFRLANLLVGNEAKAAGIEMTAAGGTFRFDDQQLVAVCGADMQARLNGKPVENWTSFWAPAGSKLVFQSAVSGYRTYLAVYGGIDVPEVMGSRSTYIDARLGGFEGRCLQQGDIIYIGKQGICPPQPRKIPKRYIPKWDTCELRIMLGPQEDFFSAKSAAHFLASAYKLAAPVNRSNYQLDGPKIPVDKKEIISSASGWGAVEVSDGGNPRILAADHGTIRGFAKLGYVAQIDFSRLAQAVPGEKIHFVETTRAKAIKALENQQKSCQKLQEKLYEDLQDYI